MTHNHFVFNAVYAEKLKIYDEKEHRLMKKNQFGEEIICSHI